MSNKNLNNNSSTHTHLEDLLMTHLFWSILVVAISLVYICAGIVISASILFLI